MKTLLIFLAGVALGFWLGRKQPPKATPFVKGDTTTPEPLLAPTTPPRGLGTPPRAGGVGGEEKAKRKERILEMFSRRTEIRNDDVEKLLGVSDASATNYLSELEKEGKIEQVGTVGRFVSYRRR